MVQNNCLICLRFCAVAQQGSAAMFSLSSTGRAAPPGLVDLLCAHSQVSFYRASVHRLLFQATQGSKKAKMEVTGLPKASILEFM